MELPKFQPMPDHGSFENYTEHDRYPYGFYTDLHELLRGQVHNLRFSFFDELERSVFVWCQEHFGNTDGIVCAFSHGTLSVRIKDQQVATLFKLQHT